MNMSRCNRYATEHTTDECKQTAFKEECCLPSIGVLGSGLFAKTTSTYSSCSRSSDALSPALYRAKTIKITVILYIKARILFVFNALIFALYIQDVLNVVNDWIGSKCHIDILQVYRLPHCTCNNNSV